ncbi:MAG: hypothetical protein ACE5DS_07015, partial [Kiloniellaceae bacterium]
MTAAKRACQSRMRGARQGGKFRALPGVATIARAARLATLAVYAAALSTAAVGTSGAHAADPRAGQVKSKPCTTCHGKDGIGTMP